MSSECTRGILREPLCPSRRGTNSVTCGLPKLDPEAGRWASDVQDMERNVPRTRPVGRPARGAQNPHDLTLENLALRQQLALLRRRSKRPQLERLDRAFWVWLSNWWPGWREALHLVRPETVIRWHRQGFRAFWSWKSRRGRMGRPGRLGACGPRAHHCARESALGCATHSRRVTQARARRLAAHRCPAHAASPNATLSTLAHVPSKPPHRPRLHRLLRRTDRDLSSAVRFRGPAASSPPGRALQRDRFPYGRLDRAANRRGVS